MTNTARQAASCVIRKEDQASCQPWEMTSFDTRSNGVTDTNSAGVTLPTIEQISEIEEQARQEGYAEGHAEGLAKGLAEGREEATRETARLRELADRFATEISQADEAISQQVLDLSLDFARAMLKSSLAINPERVIPLVREAVRYLPAIHQPALLYMNPDDVVLLQEKIGEELTKMGWQLTGDAQLEPGGCRVETAHNQIDASLPTRWQRLNAALGRDSDWLLA